MTIPDWAAQAVVYHIYPLGFLDAPRRNPREGDAVPRLLNLIDWLPHISELGATCLQLGPLFEASSHGYDTADYYAIDRRLGTLDDFRHLLMACHKAGLRVILDGVFNHSGRDFFAFQDILAHGPDSDYADWYHIDWEATSPKGDAFDYKAWDGHYSLPVFNHASASFREYLFGVMRFWLAGVGIDGWRLDVAHDLPLDFLADLVRVCKEAKPDCFIAAEVVEGNYTTWIAPGLADSGTNYQTYSATRAALKAGDLRSLRAALTTTLDHRRGIYRDHHLMNFLSNHDITRVLSDLPDQRLAYPSLILLFTLPGIPTLYYGDEVGLRGRKAEGDEALRQPMPTGEWPDSDRALYRATRRLAAIHNQHRITFATGDFAVLHASETVLAFTRHHPDEQIIVLINIAAEPQSLTLPSEATFSDVLNPGSSDLTAEGGQLHIDVIWPMWGSILVSG